ncbi:hypothetical protein ROHU_016918 [Labeo rohita]|uniref:Uncharacterized protein n=1 Tax=Labeo rohita TaxID=84645 RepID=A0A498NIU5_LABRO|nr:hypothetical protein ROHU_016918 [Labeo rohita]
MKTRGAFLFPRALRRSRCESWARRDGRSRRTTCQISVSSPSMLLASFSSSSSGAVKRERHEMDECQRNTIWPEKNVSEKAVDNEMFSLSVRLLLSAASLSCHSSIKTGREKWKQSLSLFLNASLHQIQ